MLAARKHLSLFLFGCMISMEAIIQHIVFELYSISCLFCYRINKDSVYIAQGTGSTVIDQLMQCSIVLVVIPSTALACATMCKVGTITLCPQLCTLFKI